MMINQTPINEPLDRDTILALSDDDLTTLHRLMTRAALAHLHDMTTPCCSKYTDAPEPHGLHSDDGNDYLLSSLDIANELMNNDPIMRSDHADFRNWLTNKIDPNADDTLLNYACDGIASMIYDLLWTDELDAVLDDAADAYRNIAESLTNEGN